MDILLALTLGPIATFLIGLVLYCTVAVGFEVARAGAYLLVERVGLGPVLLGAGALVLTVWVVINA